MEAAPRAAGHFGSEPGDRPMTRHGIIQRSSAGAQPPATDPRAPMVLIDVDRAAPNCVPGRQYGAEAQRSGLSASFPVPPNDASAIADTSRKWLAGSFLGDFRTPAGARNSFTLADWQLLPANHRSRTFRSAWARHLIVSDPKCRSGTPAAEWESGQMKLASLAQKAIFQISESSLRQTIHFGLRLTHRSLRDHQPYSDGKRPNCPGT